MRDTVDLNPAGVYLLEKLFSKRERAKLFRTWAGSASMLLKGGDAVWGRLRPPDFRSKERVDVLRTALTLVCALRP